MTALAILLLAAAVAFGLSKFFRLPAIPLLLLSGAGLNALAGYQAVEIPAELISEMIEIGLAVLVFTAAQSATDARAQPRGHDPRGVAIFHAWDVWCADGGLPRLRLDDCALSWLCAIGELHPRGGAAFTTTATDV